MPPTDDNGAARPMTALIREFLIQRDRVVTFAAERMGLSLIELQAVRFLIEGGQLSMHELAESVSISASGATGLANRLIKEGYAERAYLPNDRRKVMLRATRTAVDDVQRELGPPFVALDQAAGSFSPEHQRVIGNFFVCARDELHRVAEEMKPAGGPPMVQPVKSVS